ncbi:MAG TPA: hypothetical protein VGF96_08380 [Terracidiphilus sp.]|jgi:hypothetical protein
MGIAEILASVDRELGHLKQARALLGGRPSGASKKTGVSRKAAGKAVVAKPGKRKKRTLTPEGRRRIAEAQKQRWEAHKKTASAAQK